jgi:lipoprotein-anchoring transpeptidase ErfK/SrfK
MDVYWEVLISLKSIISSKWLPRTGRFFAVAALTLTTLSGWVAPALSTPPREAIVIRERFAKTVRALLASQERWILVDLKTQRLIALEGANPVYAIAISTGKASTPTRPGIFKIQTKVAKQRMRGADYNLPNVPYVMFYQGNYAIHGAYWNRQFGKPVSHGCVNVAVNHAGWLFDWASVGTPVVINP